MGVEKFCTMDADTEREKKQRLVTQNRQWGGGCQKKTRGGQQQSRAATGKTSWQGSLPTQGGGLGGFTKKRDYRISGVKEEGAPRQGDCPIRQKKKPLKKKYWSFAVGTLDMATKVEGGLKKNGNSNILNLKKIFRQA